MTFKTGADNLLQFDTTGDYKLSIGTKNVAYDKATINEIVDNEAESLMFASGSDQYIVINTVADGAIEINKNVEIYNNLIVSDTIFSQILDVSGNATIHGDLIVEGNNVSLNAQKLEIEDNKVLLNSNASDFTSVPEFSGIEINLGGGTGNLDEKNFFFVFEKSRENTGLGRFVIGKHSRDESGNLASPDFQIVNTRTDDPPPGGVSFWDNDNTITTFNSDFVYDPITGLKLNGDIDMVDNNITNIETLQLSETVTTSSAGVDNSFHRLIYNTVDISGIEPTTNNILYTSESISAKQVVNYDLKLLGVHITNGDKISVNVQAVADGNGNGTASLTVEYFQEQVLYFSNGLNAGNFAVSTDIDVDKVVFKITQQDEIDLDSDWVWSLSGSESSVLAVV